MCVYAEQQEHGSALNEHCHERSKRAHNSDNMVLCYRKLRDYNIEDTERQAEHAKNKSQEESQM